MDVLLDGLAKRYSNAAGIADVVKVVKGNLRAELTCVADFARAEQALADNDRKGAIKRFQATQKDVPLLELHVAQAELRRLM